MEMNAINLILSNRCQAACIWCPSSRGTSQKADMSIELVQKIFEEASDSTFPYTIESIRLSENGEAIINKNFFEIARYIRKKMPNARIDMLSNFLALDSEKAKIMIEEKLIDAITVNIDGHDKASYEAVKRINYDRVITNLKAFNNIHIANNSHIDILVNAMPAYEYVQTVETIIQHKPANLIAKNVPYSDVSLVMESISFMGQNPRARFKHSKPGFWAERKLIKEGIVQQPIPNSELNCPQLKRVKEEIFISPHGDCYPCCLDDNQDISLGNVNDMSLVQIYESNTRKDFIYKLENRMFDDIGYPCNTVFACQVISQWK